MNNRLFQRLVLRGLYFLIPNTYNYKKSDQWKAEVDELLSKSEQPSAPLPLVKSISWAIETGLCYEGTADEIANSVLETLSETHVIMPKENLITRYSVIAYDDSGYGDNRSKDFFVEADAMIYAQALDDRFKPVIYKKIETRTNLSAKIWSREDNPKV